MKYERIYIQFNELVFDGVDMISDFDGDMSFKGSSIDKGYGHGKYRPYKADYLFVDERTVSMTITLKMQKLPCEYRPYYNQFVLTELSKPGRLWSIKNNELLWAFASVTNISEDYSGKEDTLVYDVNFVIPGGVWHKADKQKTFIVPWDVCTFMDCMGYETLHPCVTVTKSGGDCCQDCIDRKIEQKIKENDDCSCCCEDVLCKDMALCFNEDKLASAFGCYATFRVVYDCAMGEEFAENKFTGQKFCVKDICNDSVIVGRFYSETDIPTTDVTVIIDGIMHNPWVTINGNTNVISGDYEGSLIIKPNGDVYHKTDCCETLLDPSVWIVPAGNDYGWTVYPRHNTIKVNLNICCNTMTCVYIQHQPITV